MAETSESPAPSEWAILELMGHRRLGGRVREEIRFGAEAARRAARAVQPYTDAERQLPANEPDDDDIPW